DVITIIGVALVIFSIISYFWRKRRGGNMMQDSNTVLWVMALGAILCAPQVIFPLVLKLFDQIINAGNNILNTGRGSAGSARDVLSGRSDMTIFGEKEMEMTYTTMTTVRLSSLSGGGH